MIEATLLWQDEDFRAIVKPLGVETSQCLAIGEHAAHRLDQPTSGVLLIACSAWAAEASRLLFANRRIEKIYWAITVRPLAKPQGHLRHWLAHQSRGNKSQAYSEAIRGCDESWLDYRLVAQGDRYPLYEIRLGTGRTHQIRAQLAAEGAPIRGDLKYGAPRSNPGGGINLLARRLAFLHPRTGQPIELVADPPAGDRLWAALASAIIPDS